MCSADDADVLVLALVLGDQPFRTGLFFYLGALTATLAVGVAAAFVHRRRRGVRHAVAARRRGWQSLDVARGGLLLLWVVDLRRQPYGPREAGTCRQDGQRRVVAVDRRVGAGAMLANPGTFIPIALKTISETDPRAPRLRVEWLFFALVSLLPLLVALVLLLVAPSWALRMLGSSGPGSSGIGAGGR